MQSVTGSTLLEAWCGKLECSRNMVTLLMHGVAGHHVIETCSRLQFAHSASRATLSALQRHDQEQPRRLSQTGGSGCAHLQRRPRWAVTLRSFVCARWACCAAARAGPPAAGACQQAARPARCQPLMSLLSPAAVRHGRVCNRHELAEHERRRMSRLHSCWTLVAVQAPSLGSHEAAGDDEGVRTFVTGLTTA